MRRSFLKPRLPGAARHQIGEGQIIYLPYTEVKYKYFATTMIFRKSSAARTIDLLIPGALAPAGHS